MSGPQWRAGWHAERAEFRSTDLAGRPVDAVAETETQRTERIRSLQDARLAAGPREIPSAEPGAVLREWMQDPGNRMSAFAGRLAADPSMVPVVEIEPWPDEPVIRGGLYERAQQRAQRRG